MRSIINMCSNQNQNIEDVDKKERNDNEEKLDYFSRYAFLHSIVHASKIIRQCLYNICATQEIL